MSENLLERQLVAAVRFARQGDKLKAKPLLEEILKQERTNEQAWIWLAAVVDSPKERRICIERVIKINPRNTAAQATLNTLVGVLAGAEQPKIDYEALSKAAAKPLPVTGTRKEAAPPPRNLAAGGQRNLRPFLIGGAVILGVLFLLTLIPSSGIFTDVPTATATSFVEITEEPSATVDPLYTPPSPTIAPTATFNGVFVDVTRAFELPPTFTPTITPTSTNTPTATATLPGLLNYNWFFLATQGTSLPALYRMNGSGDGLEVLIANIAEFDYDIATGLLAFTEPSQSTDEAGTITSVSRLFIAPIGSLDQRTEITNSNMPNAIAPAISPDGSRLAFAANVGGDYEIYIYEIASRTMRQITNNPIDDIDPDWSAAGSNLVYASNPTSPLRHQLYNVSASDADAETNAVRITELSSDNVDPAWSPSSGQIVFVSKTSSGTSIVLTDANNAFTRELSFIPSNIFSEPAWTLDGNYVVFTSGPEGGDQTMYLVPPQGGPELSYELDGFNVLRIMQR